MSYEKKRKAYVTTRMRACATHHIYAPIFYSLQACRGLVMSLTWLVMSLSYHRLRQATLS